MAGTDLRQGTGTKPDKVLTIDDDGKVGTGEGLASNIKLLQKGSSGTIEDAQGNIYDSKPGKVIAEGVGSDKSVDLTQHIAGGQGDIYEVYAYTYHNGIDLHVFAKLLYIPDTQSSTKVESLNSSGSPTWEIDNSGILDYTGGGTHAYRVRLRKLMHIDNKF